MLWVGRSKNWISSMDSPLFYRTFIGSQNRQKRMLKKQINYAKTFMIKEKENHEDILDLSCTYEFIYQT